MIQLKGEKNSERSKAMGAALGLNKSKAAKPKEVKLGMSSKQKFKEKKHKRKPHVYKPVHGPGGPVIIQSKSEPKQDDEKSASESDSDFDSDLDDDDNALEIIRARRLAAMKAEQLKKQEFKQLGHLEYLEINEEEFLPSVTGSKYAVVAFFHKDFERCKIVDKHLALIAPKHLATRFIRLNAEKAPFFVQKLQIKMLPTVILFKDGVAVDRIVGFEELGKRDDFKTEVLEKRIAGAGLLIYKDEDGVEHEIESSIRQGNNRNTTLLDAKDWVDRD